MPQEEKLYDLAEQFKVFGDTTRLSSIRWRMSISSIYLTRLYCIL